MLKLAQQYAKLRNTKVISHREHDEGITFVLESGQKLTFTEAQLQAEIEALQPVQKPEPKAKADKPKPEPKAKADKPKPEPKAKADKPKPEPKG